MIKRDIIKVPVSSYFITPTFVNIHDTSKYYYRMDVFYDDSWDKTEKRKVVVHFMGAGVNSPYKLDNPMVLRYAEEGWVTCVVYYYQPNFKDPETNIVTTPPFWNESFGIQRNQQHHLRARSIMAQSALEYVVDNIKSTTTLNVDTDNIYFTAKSRGGATCLAWSTFYVSYKYADNVKLIVNSQGYSGSATTEDPENGFLSWKNTIGAMSHCMTWIRHKFVHVYNDKDHGYDLTSRLSFSIPSNRLALHTFMNFTDYGHTQINDFYVAAIKADIDGIPLIYDGLRLYNQEELTQKMISEN